MSDDSAEPLEVCPRCWVLFWPKPAEMPQVRLSAWELSKASLCQVCDKRRELWLRQALLTAIPERAAC